MTTEDIIAQAFREERRDFGKIVARKMREENKTSQEVLDTHPYLRGAAATINRIDLRIQTRLIIDAL